MLTHVKYINIPIWMTHQEERVNQERQGKRSERNSLWLFQTGWARVLGFCLLKRAVKAFLLASSSYLIPAHHSCHLEVASVHPFGYWMCFWNRQWVRSVFSCCPHKLGTLASSVLLGHLNQLLSLPPSTPVLESIGCIRMRFSVVSLSWFLLRLPSLIC